MEQEYVTMQIEKSIFEELSNVMETAEKNLRSLAVYEEMMDIITAAIKDRQELSLRKDDLIMIDGIDIFTCVKAERHAKQMKERRDGRESK